MGNETNRRKTAAEKRRDALTLKVAGVTYDEIAKQVGYANRGGAHRAVMQELANIPKTAADQLRQIELEGFETIQRRLMTRLATNDLSVIPQLLALSDRRVRLLGLTKIEADDAVTDLKAALGGFLVDAISQDRQREQFAALGEDADRLGGLESD